MAGLKLLNVDMSGCNGRGKEKNTVPLILSRHDRCYRRIRKSGIVRVPNLHPTNPAARSDQLHQCVDWQIPNTVESKTYFHLLIFC